MVRISSRCHAGIRVDRSRIGAGTHFLEDDRHDATPLRLI
jgi:hypothetical protein